jgi:hypothetical protein
MAGIGRTPVAACLGFPQYVQVSAFCRELDDKVRLRGCGSFLERNIIVYGLQIPASQIKALVRLWVAPFRTESKPALKTYW